jgi:predicted ATPase
MRLKKIEVSKLFGVFDHTIQLNLTDKITIIHGPNGYGKTALLQMVQSLVGNHFNRLRRVPFMKFTLTMEDGREISVTKSHTPKGDGEKTDRASALQFELKLPSNGKQEFTLDFSAAREGLGIPLAMIERHVDDLKRVGVQTWISLETGRQLDLEDVIEAYGEVLPVRTKKLRKVPEWLSELPNSLNVRLIEAQRLLNAPRTKRMVLTDAPMNLQPAVSAYSKDLADDIQEVQAKYGTFSQQLDSTFPNRVLQTRSVPSPDVEVLTQKLQDLEERRQRIIAAGLLTKEQYGAPLFDPQTQVDDSTKNILSLYSEDVEKKLGVFEEITTKVELFKELVNKRFSYKQMDVDRQNGFRLRTFANLPLLPTDLSSGEQHELVLLYELLFKTKPNALILIDEPELSLHVAWQVEFLKDLARVIKVSSFDVILATHSPQIINDRWDLAVELQGPKK